MKQDLKKQLYTVIFEADTKAGKIFDVVLLLAILASVLLVIMESIEPLNIKYHILFHTLEWIITIIFSIEYLLRVWVFPKPIKYVFSFYGIIDLLAISPTFLAFFVAGANHLMIIRALRFLRVFRVLKLSRYTKEGGTIIEALKTSRQKITVFTIAVLTIVLIVGTSMYLIEGPENGFTNIPKSMYWAIVTLTTVGYGDIAPQTPGGQVLSSLLMILGYAIIAVPTGIVTAEFAKNNIQTISKECQKCKHSNNPKEALYCCNCGERLSN